MFQIWERRFSLAKLNTVTGDYFSYYFFYTTISKCGKFRLIFELEYFCLEIMVGKIIKRSRRPEIYFGNILLKYFVDIYSWWNSWIESGDNQPKEAMFIHALSCIFTLTLTVDKNTDDAEEQILDLCIIKHEKRSISCIRSSLVLFPRFLRNRT